MGRGLGFGGTPWVGGVAGGVVVWVCRLVFVSWVVYTHTYPFLMAWNRVQSQGPIGGKHEWLMDGMRGSARFDSQSRICK